MVEVTYLGALLGGLLSFLSPCVLPLVPAYLSYISGVEVDTLRAGDDGRLKWRALVQALWFVAGFSLVFIALGATATVLGGWLLANLDILVKAAGIVIFVFGMHYAGLIRIPFLMFEARLNPNANAVQGFGALVLGAAFAFGWTPCVGPILGAILAVAGAQSQVSEGILLLTIYSAGLAIPFIVAALAMDRFMHWAQGFKRHFRVVELVSGVLLMLVGVLIFTGSFTMLAAWVLEWFPALANIESLATP